MVLAFVRGELLPVEFVNNVIAVELFGARFNLECWNVGQVLARAF